MAEDQHRKVGGPMGRLCPFHRHSCPRWPTQDTLLLLARSGTGPAYRVAGSVHPGQHHVALVGTQTLPVELVPYMNEDTGPRCSSWHWVAGSKPDPLPSWCPQESLDVHGASTLQCSCRAHRRPAHQAQRGLHCRSLSVLRWLSLRPTCALGLLPVSLQEGLVKAAPAPAPQCSDPLITAVGVQTPPVEGGAHSK